MNAPTDVTCLLSDCRSTDKLRQAIESACAELGDVLNVTLICREDNAARKLCVIDMMPGSADVHTCAHRLGGRVFGYSAVIIDLVPHPEFACPAAMKPGAEDCSCAPKP